MHNTSRPEIYLVMLNKSSFDYHQLPAFYQEPTPPIFNQSNRT